MSEETSRQRLQRLAARIADLVQRDRDELRRIAQRVEQKQPPPK